MPEKRLESKSVLIVDDEPELREVFSFEFEMEGAKVLNAGGGREAFDIVKRGGVDLIVSDIRMAAGDGVELLEKVKELNASTPPVILLSGFTDLTLWSAYQKGVDGIFGKPFEVEQLMEFSVRVMKSRLTRWSEPMKNPGTKVSEPIQLPTIKLGSIGVFLPMSLDFPKMGSSIHFEIKHLNAEVELIAGSGVVRWVRTSEEQNLPPGIGVEFFGLNESVCQKFDKILSKNTDQKVSIPEG